jgi:hypothetical protein
VRTSGEEITLAPLSLGRHKRRFSSNFADLAPGIGNQTNIINSSPTHQAHVQCLEQNPHIDFTNEMPDQRDSNE